MARFIYWPTRGTIGSIDRANIDGTGKETPWIELGGKPQGVWVNETHIFWCLGANAIGRANLDGTEPDEEFIKLSEGKLAMSVTTDDTYLYYVTSGAEGDIGRAKLDGSELDETFVENVKIGERSGIVVNATHIFWTSQPTPFLIGRAKIDGSEVEKEFITPTRVPADIDVDESFIYWGHPGAVTDGIARANLDGTEVDEEFVADTKNVSGVAVDSTYVYWIRESDTTIGRANLDGTEPNTIFIFGLLDKIRRRIVVTPEAGVVKVVAPPATATASAPAPTLSGETKTVQAVVASVTASAPVPIIAAGVTINVWIDGKLQSLKRWVKVGGELLNR